MVHWATPSVIIWGNTLVLFVQSWHLSLHACLSEAVMHHSFFKFVGNTHDVGEGHHPLLAHSEHMLRGITVRL